MSKDIIGPELLSSSLFALPTGETGYHPQAYVDFRHSFKGGGTIIFHGPDEQKSAAGIIEGLPIQMGEDKRHFAAAVSIPDDARHKQTLDALEGAGFKKEDPKGEDYKLEEEIRSVH